MPPPPATPPDPAAPAGSDQATDPAGRAAGLDPDSGLRERKKRQTHAALVDAALRLVGAKGLDEVTVEQISAAAEVSPRTFFNYFTSKEEALVGTGPVAPTDDELAEFAAGGPDGRLLADLGVVLARHLDRHLVSSDLLTRRHELLHREPELQVRFRANLRHIEDRLAAAVATRQGRDAHDPDLRMLVAIAMIGIRTSLQGWARSRGAGPVGDHVAAAFARLDRAVDVETLLAATDRP